MRKSVIGCSVHMLIVVFSGVLWQSASASEGRLGPSFDCEKASTKIEKTICADKGLSLSDRALDKLYRAKRVIPTLRDEVKASQLKWLRTERAKCGREVSDSSRVACLDAAYKKRKEELYLAKVNPSGRSDMPPVKFKLMTGSQYPLCRDYVAMLNQTGYIDAPVCERRVLPGFSKFQAIEWEGITDKKEIEKIRREQILMQSLWPPSRQQNAKRKWLEAKDKMESGGWPVLEKARVDVDPDNQEDTVYRFVYSKRESEKYGVCGNLTSYFVIYDDPDKYRSVYERPIRSLGGPPTGAHEIFYYEGRAFQDYWNGWVGQYQIKVNEMSGIPDQVCGINIVRQGDSN